MKSSHVIGLILFSVVIGGCANDSTAEDSKRDSLEVRSRLSIVCLDGVQYYKGHYALTPVVDADTLKFKQCKL